MEIIDIRIKIDQDLQDLGIYGIMSTNIYNLNPENPIILIQALLSETLPSFNKQMLKKMSKIDQFLDFLIILNKNYDKGCNTWRDNDASFNARLQKIRTSQHI